MSTRREFFSSGTAFLAAANAQADTPSALIEGGISLNGSWLFRLDPEATGESSGWMAPEVAPVADWREVRVPHTWQVEAANAEYYGPAWYRRTFEAPKVWSDSAVRIEFEAVFHTATVWVNGKKQGSTPARATPPLHAMWGRFCGTAR